MGVIGEEGGWEIWVDIEWEGGVDNLGSERRIYQQRPVPITGCNWQGFYQGYEGLPCGGKVFQLINTRHNWWNEKMDLSSDDTAHTSIFDSIYWT